MGDPLMGRADEPAIEPREPSWQQGPSRRRVLTLTAALATLGTVGAVAPLKGLAGNRAADVPPQVWRGLALGAQASITLYHPDPEAGHALIEDCLSEIRRLEAIFSLYRADSALRELNANALLVNPPPDLRRLLSAARRFSDLSGGAFDVTVQPLWELYAAHFAAEDAAPEGPSEAALAVARLLVDYRALRLENRRIAFGRPGMAATLNGIAQGYVTDRVAALLRRAGMDQVLIDLGEIRALGAHPTGRPWRVGVQDPQASEQIFRTLPLRNAALATSAGSGTVFDRNGRFHHLFEPRSGRSAARHASVTVLAPDATTADALSTAFSALPLERAEAICTTLPEVKALFVAPDGAVTTVGL